jgi:hypothetical protein
MKCDLESMYSNNVGYLVKVSNGIELLVVNRFIRERKEWMGRLKPSRQDWWLKVLLKKKGLIMRKLFRLLPCLNPFGYSWPLPLILTMRF